MSSILTSTATCAESLSTQPRPMAAGALARLPDFITLSKPRIGVMVLVAVSVGYAVGCRGEFDVALWLDALLGIGTIATGCSVLNQWLERDTDARMRRTERRPLPSGRISPAEALTLGVALAAFGCVWLLMFVNSLTALLTFATLVAYVGIYTPLKRHTSLCTTIGAVPGALPPVLGWTAAGGGLDLSAGTLFAILFLWQFPHFLAIAWIYRDDYRGAGLRMLPTDASTTVVGRMAVSYALVLLPVSLLPRQIGLAGDMYFWVALVLGAAYLAASTAFARDETRATARRLLLTSLVYLPALLAALTLDHWRLLN